MAKYNEFGQMGSIYRETAGQVTPPYGMCIVAIQFLADNILTELTPIDNVNGNNYEYIGHANTAHNGPATTQNTGGGASTAGSNTLTLSGANAAIKPGMLVTGTGIPVVSSTTEGIKVERISGTTLTLSRGVPSIGGGVTLSFWEKFGSGNGGRNTAPAVFPKGITIYGKWKSCTPTADANGGIICYLGALNE